MASVNMSIRTDSELKAQAEAILSQLGMTMNGTINMFLHQIVRDKAVPLSLSLTSEQGFMPTFWRRRLSGLPAIPAAPPLTFLRIWIRSLQTPKTRVQSDAVHCHFCQQSGRPASKACGILSTSQYPRSKSVPQRIC